MFTNIFARRKIYNFKLRMNCNKIKLCVSLANQINRMTRLNNLEAKFTKFMFDML